MSEVDNLTKRHPDLLKDLSHGNCVLFIGDTLDDGGPQGQRLASALVDAVGLYARCPRDDCRGERHCALSNGCAVPLPEAAQLYKSRHNRTALVRFVRDFIASHYPTHDVASIYQALVALPVSVIVTTLYDDRLESALRQINWPYLSIVGDERIALNEPREVQLVRLRGTVSEPESLVLTEDDMVDVFVTRPLVKTILKAKFASETLLFAGYDLGDRYFHTLHRQVTASVARVRRLAYAIQWPPDQLARERWRDAITFLDYDEPASIVRDLLRSARVQREVARQTSLPPEPYKFLEYYTAQDAAIFFGRELEAELLQSAILTQQLTVFYGRSGTGKTSLLLARVTPALERAEYSVAYARMLGDPVSEVKAAVRGVPLGQLAYADRGRRLVDVLADSLPPVGRLIIILDQFEEFFLRQGAAVRQDFARELADCLANDRDLDVRFVLALRDDYLGALDEISALLPQDVFAHRYRLENLTQEKALMAILKPAEAFGLPVEVALRDQLVADLDDQGLEPANLQIVLYRLYVDAVANNLWSPTTKAGPGLTLARYQALEGTSAILAGYLDEVLADLSDEERRQAQAILKSMVTADQTKVAIKRSEVERNHLVTQLGLTETSVDASLAFLRERRVVRKFGDEERYELAHEVMVDKVWAWFDKDELHLLDLRDMLRREFSTYQKFGHLIARDRLALLTPYRDAIVISAFEAELLLRSALAARYEHAYWYERAVRADVDMTEIVSDYVQSDDFRVRALAITLITREQPEKKFIDALIVLLADDYPQVRLAALNALERLQPEGGWRDQLRHECYVPAGPFLMGSEDGREKSLHEQVVDACYMGKYPVTNADYKRYMDDRGRTFDIPQGKEHHPVVNVSWYDAQEYVLWANEYLPEDTAWAIRLPTEPQWEKAAGWHADEDGDKGRKRRYPWGDDFDAKKCNTSESGIGGTSEVGRFSPQGDSPYGCVDMAGNVWEWTSSLRRNYPYRADDGREDMTSSDSRTLRGGSWYESSLACRVASRFDFNPDFRVDNLGFRLCVCRPPSHGH